MKKNLVPKEEFIIPTEFDDYKFVIFIAKTTSKKYEFILYTISKQPNYKITINNKLWHIVGFKHTADELINLSNLLMYAEGLTNIHIYQDKMLTSSLHYKLFNILECLQNTNNIDDKKFYCNEDVKTLKTKFNDPWKIGSEFEIVIKADDSKKTEFIDIQGVEQTFPCHKVNNSYFNPYEHKESNLKNMYLAYALKKNAHIVNLCPLFDISKYSCTFVDKTIIKN